MDQTLAGRADRIKSYTVATDVFGRNTDFDLKNDPVVRVEAGRLRQALERYYLAAGRNDPVLIDIPKGGYVPQFSWGPMSAQAVAAPDAHPATTTNSADWHSWGLLALVAILVAVLGGSLVWWPRLWLGPVDSSDTASEPEGPSLVVRPFVNLGGAGDAYYAAGVTEEILAQLARFKELRVIGRETTQTLSPVAQSSDIRRELGAHYVLEGSLRVSEGRLRVTGRLLHGASSRLVWSQTYDGDLRAPNGPDIEADIGAKVATAIAQPYGVIFKPTPRNENSRTPGGLEAYQCGLRFYRYRTALSEAEHGTARDCLEQTTVRFPNFSTGWAMLSYLYLDEDRFALNRRAEGPSPMVRAREAADRAVRLDPDNVRALQALMTVLFFNQEPAEALRVGQQALALNPNDTELLGELGFRIAQAGDWQRGSSMLEQALARNPGHSGYYVGMLALAAYMQNDVSRAVELIRRADLKQFSIYHIAAAIIFSRAGLAAEARESRAQFLAMRPRFFDDFEGELAKRNFNPRDRAVLTEAARHAGFPVALRHGPG